MIEDLLTAVYRRDRRTLDRLLKSGADINERDRDGRTALIHAILDSESDPDFVAYLIDLNADVDTVDNGQSWSALHFAARDNKVEIVDILARSGAEIGPVDVFGNTPLWRCVMNCGNDYAVVRILLDAGADAHKPNLNGNSPIKVAETRGNEELALILEN